MREKIQLKMQELIEEYCKENDVVYINMYDKLLDEEGNFNKEYTNDGLHPNEDGYKKITEILEKYLD